MMFHLQRVQRHGSTITPHAHSFFYACTPLVSYALDRNVDTAISPFYVVDVTTLSF